MKKLRVVEQTEKGRTICCTIEALISPKSVKKIITQAVNKRKALSGSHPITSNNCLEIINIQYIVPLEDKNMVIGFPSTVTFNEMEAIILSQVYKVDAPLEQAPPVFLERGVERGREIPENVYVKEIRITIKALCEIHSDRFDASKRVGINFFDSGGDPIGTDSKPPDNKTLIPGQIDTVTFKVEEYPEVKSYGNSFEIFLAK